MNNDTMLTAQHSTAQHSTAQHSTAQHSTAQHSTAQHSLRRRLLISSQKADDNLIDLNAYGESANMFVQDITADNTKAYFAYDVSYIVCYSKWGSNLGLAEINNDGEVIIKPGTMMVKININNSTFPADISK